jgi:hypothetical protein
MSNAGVTRWGGCAGLASWSYPATRRPERDVAAAVGNVQIDAVDGRFALRITLGQGNEFNSARCGSSSLAVMLYLAANTGARIVCGMHCDLCRKLNAFGAHRCTDRPVWCHRLSSSVHCA